MFDQISVSTDTAGTFSADLSLNRPVTFANFIAPVEASETLEARFARLTKEWVEEAAYKSFIEDVIETEAYQQIISLGRSVVKRNIVSLILSDLQKSPKPWFYALHVITAVDPIPARAAGNTKKMVAAWVQWGQTHGYI